jgi:hypothetical protein
MEVVCLNKVYIACNIQIFVLGEIRFQLNINQGSGNRGKLPQMG